MSSVKTGWKAVLTNKSEKRLYSLAVGDSTIAKVEYQVGKWTEPNDECGPLAVFSNATYAMDFLRLMVDWSIANISKRMMMYVSTKNHQTRGFGVLAMM